MKRYCENHLDWLEFDLLADIPKVKHAVYLRQGGFSQGPYASFNLDLEVGDNPEHVLSNYQRLEKKLKQQIPQWKQLVWGRANHGKCIASVNEHSPQIVSYYDGLITSTPGVTLMMRHADCQVALFYDPKNHASANIHAGWRGSVVNIYAEAVLKMRQAFNSHPSDLLVCISPSLGPNEAEFIHYQSELPEEFWHFQVRPTYFDFWSISEHQLQAAGVLPHHIEVARLSTYANAYDYFSYRRDKITGRHGSCITLL